jgi:tRNA dimethylallyltransferase
LKQIAILGATASGKTSLSIELAKKYNGVILSLDSLSIYKEIDIASAKPSIQERDGILHFGIDEIHVDDVFNVMLFFELYKKAVRFCKNNEKNLIIVGGTGFYLKSMIEGISHKPHVSKKMKEQIKEELLDLKTAYLKIEELDIKSASQIKANDTYRIEKWFEIYYGTNLIPSEYFQKEQRAPIITDIKLYEVDIEKDLLRERIAQRTDMMLKNGLIDEVVALEKRYTRLPNPMKAIGIKETLDFLDGNLSKEELHEKIVTNTARLAKRQRTFNKTQFEEHFKGDVKTLKNKIVF